MSSRLAKSLMLSAALAATAAQAAPETGPKATVHTSKPKPPAPSGARPKDSVRIFKSDMKALAAPKGPLDVRVAETKEFSRVELHWTGAVVFTTQRHGRELILLFNRFAEPDLSRLTVDPPPFIERAEARRARGGGLELALILAEGAEVKTGRADGAVYVNVYAPPEPAEVSKAEPQKVPPVVHVESLLKGPDLQLGFPFVAPVGAALFRRGEAIWLVFDADTKLDVAKLPAGLRQAGRIEPIRGPGFTALRITAPANVHPSISALKGRWTLTLGPRHQPSSPVTVEPDRDAGPAALSAALAGSTAVRWLDDPVVGDRLAVVTALGPAKGLAAKRTTVEAVLLATTHGLVVQPLTDDVSVDADGDLVRVFRPQGLALSAGKRSGRPARAAVELPLPAVLPAVIDPAWAKTGEGGFLARYHGLMGAAAKQNGSAAMFGLARFLIGSDMVHEGIGVLETLRVADQRVLGDPEFRGLRGAARVLAGRYKEAEADFASPPLIDDPSAALWRGYIAWHEADPVYARDQLAAGASALGRFAPVHRARFARAIAETAMDAGDLAQAAAQLKIARTWKVPPEESLGLSLAQAKLAEAQGKGAAALKIYEIVAKAPLGALSAEAELRATRLKQVAGLLDADKAAAAYEALRWRWRGDNTELEIIRTLGRLYLDQGRYREALGVMRTAGSNLPNSPVSISLHNDMTNAFRGLFLDGGADGLEPVQALALFYDFKELTPVGSDGDMMSRRLAQRLVSVDLLTHAAELLEYQATNRLEGVPRAQVATDLALIYLMDRKPEQALAAIGASRTTVLPNTLNLERRVLEARALMQIGRLDHALEVLGRDPSPDALAVRAEVYWKQKAWPRAGAALEQSLAGRSGPLSAAEESRLLKAAVAYSLAGDDAALARLRGRFDGQIAGARAPDALRVALSGVDAENVTPANLTRIVSEADAFSGWVGEMKRRYRAKSVKQAAAAGPAKG